MAYILAHIKRSAEAQAVATANPREELDRYLKDRLRESGTDVLKWWPVRQILIASYLQLTEMP
jgi:hypothetical protein